MRISVVVPVYGCRPCLPELCERLFATAEQLGTEMDVVLVNDASPDCAWDIICELALLDPRVKGVNLSRNFGQHYAISAGLQYATGDWIVVMDCDLQDQPEELAKLYAKAQEGYDVVYGRRHDRQDSFLKRTGSALFYKALSFLTDTQLDPTIANFSIASRRVIEAVRAMGERNQFYPLRLKWVGFRTTAIDIAHAARAEGKSSYSFRKLARLAIDVVVTHSHKPLTLSVYFGFSMALFALAYAAWLTLRYFLYHVPVEGWTSVIVSIWLLGGLVFANLGVLGLYLGKVFEEVKGRPLFIVAETINVQEHRPADVEEAERCVLAGSE